MCLPVGGRKEVVSLMQQQSEKISYLSGKMAENVYEKELLSLWNDVGEEAQNAFTRKTLIDREEKLGILDKGLANGVREYYKDDNNYCVNRLENAFFNDTIISSGIMYEYDDVCSSFVKIVETADEMQEQKPAEEEIQGEAHNWVSDVIKNYTSGVFPIYDYNPEKVQFLVNGTYRGEPFIGLRASADACVSLVDSIDSFLNNLLLASAITGAMTKLLSAMKAAVLFGASLQVYLQSVIAPLWAKIVAFLSTTPIGLAISLILTVLAAVAISTIISLFVCGCMYVDYMSGVIIHGWFNYEFVSTDITNQIMPNTKPVLFS